MRGKIFGLLYVIAIAGKKHNDNQWWTECNCGEFFITSTGNLHSKNTRSCGCFNRESLSKRRTIHGHSVGKSPTYLSWQGMKKRCLDLRHKHYSNYGGRGVTVCDRWMHFENFLADMGKRPAGLTLERINNDGNYEPSNCKWATWKEQAQNKRSRKNKCQ